MMTTTTLPNTAICCPRRPRNRVKQWVQAIWVPIKRWNKRYRDIQHLRGLTDQQLDDIAIRRSEIRSVVYGHAADRVRLIDLLLQ